jgi:hypothetical protein
VGDVCDLLHVSETVMVMCCEALHQHFIENLSLTFECLCVSVLVVFWQLTRGKCVYLKVVALVFWESTFSFVERN